MPDNSWRQRHANLAIACNAWQYYQTTLDREFLSYHSAETLLEIARFFANVTRYNEELDRCETLGVVGPDEYHEAYPGAEEGKGGLNNNTYTNMLVVWLMVLALKRHECRSRAYRDVLTACLENSFQSYSAA